MSRPTAGGGARPLYSYTVSSRRAVVASATAYSSELPCQTAHLSAPCSRYHPTTLARCRLPLDLDQSSAEYKTRMMHFNEQTQNDNLTSDPPVRVPAHCRTESALKWKHSPKQPGQTRASSSRTIHISQYWRHWIWDWLRYRRVRTVALAAVAWARRLLHILLLPTGAVSRLASPVCAPGPRGVSQPRPRPPRGIQRLVGALLMRSSRRRPRVVPSTRLPSRSGRMRGPLPARRPAHPGPESRPRVPTQADLVLFPMTQL